MAEPTWVQQVRQQSEGPESRTDRELTDRTAYLKKRVDAAEFGQAVFAHDVTLDPDVLEGYAVYWNDESQRFEAALAGVESDEESGVLVPTLASDCLGVVFAKEFANKGSVLLFGYAELDITNSAGDNPVAGRYYLSAVEPGKLLRQRPAVTVAVLYYDGNGKVYVQPSNRNFAEDHVHFSFDLVCRPAGSSDQPVVGERHVIKTLDVTAQGWLPASAFGSRAPRRAAFGYNLTAHAELAKVWPPVPLSAVSLEWDRGNGHLGGTTVPLGADGLVIVDSYGIWWMSDCYGDVPWPTETNTSQSSYPSESYPSSDTSPECQRFEKMRLKLNLAKMTFATNKSAVTSLQPAAGSPIRFTDCDGVQASTGDLFAGLDTEFLIDENDVDGNLAIKDLSGSKFKRGYMVQGVLSGNSNLTVTGTRTKVIGEKTYYQGLLEFSVNLDPAARDLPTQLVRLDDVKERFYQDVMYLGMPADQESSIRARIKVPGDGLPSTPKVKLRVQILGRVTGTLPVLTVSYRIIPRPSVATALPTTDTALVFNASQGIATDEYVEVESDPFTVAAGDTVLFTISRADDGYSGEVGLLDIVGILFAGA